MIAKVVGEGNVSVQFTDEYSNLAKKIRIVRHNKDSGHEDAMVELQFADAKRLKKLLEQHPKNWWR